MSFFSSGKLVDKSSFYRLVLFVTIFYTHYVLRDWFVWTAGLLAAASYDVCLVVVISFQVSAHSCEYFLIGNVK